MEVLLTVEQAATRLQMSPKTVRAQLRSGELRGIRRGRQWRIEPKALSESSPSPIKADEVEALAEKLWARLGTFETHNAAIGEIAKALAKVRELIAAKSEAFESIKATMKMEATP